MPVLDPVRSELADDPDFVELISLFVGDVPEKIARLRALGADDDREELQVFAHQLKGSSGGYGFSGLSAVARRLEVACKADLTSLASEVDATIEYLERLTV